MKKKIAITGGIGSGKSTVLKHIADLGYPVFSCDEIYREIIQTKEYVSKIRTAFPSCITDGKIDRKILSELVFKNEEKRLLLNSIAHPLIMQRLVERMQISSSTLVFAEVPLLFEGGFENLFDCVVIVIRDKEKRVNSVALRDGITRSEIENRICSQFDYSSQDAKNRFKKCNAIFLKNEDDEEALKSEITLLLSKL